MPPKSMQTEKKVNYTTKLDHESNNWLGNSRAKYGEYDLTLSTEFMLFRLSHMGRCPRVFHTPVVQIDHDGQTSKGLLLPNGDIHEIRSCNGDLAISSTRLKPEEQSPDTPTDLFCRQLGIEQRLTTNAQHETSIPAYPSALLRVYCIQGGIKQHNIYPKEVYEGMKGLSSGELIQELFYDSPFVPQFD